MTSIRIAAWATMMAALPHIASADTYTWTGNGADSRVSLGANWAGSVAPSSIATGDSWIFGTSNRYSVDIITNRTAGSLTSNDAAAYTFSDAILNVGGITQNSTGAEVFNNIVNALSAQTWTLGSGTGSMAFTKGVGLANIVTIAPAGNNIIGCNFSGSGGLTINGAGTLTLNGTSTYTGDTNINAGTLRITATSGLLGTAVHVGGGTLLLDGGVIGDANAPLTQSIDNGTLQMTAGYLNASTLRVSNGGTSGTVTQSGGTVSVAGDIAVGGTGSTGNFPGFGGTGTYNLSGGTVSGGSLTLGGDRTGTLNQSGGTVSVNSVSMTSGATAGNNNYYTLSAGSLTTNGLTMASGSLTYGTGAITQTGGVLTVNGNIVYATPYASGTYALNGGELHVNNIVGSASIFNSPTFGLNGGTLFVGADNAAFGSVVKQWNVGAGGAKIDTAGHTVTLGGTLVSAATADGGLTKSGAGTLTVSSPTYNGPTIATGGTLKIANLTTASPVTASTGG
ncbi:MAG: beta strand repeat-containing protein, partial [Tepidisphaeraceae bacterium]